MADSLLALLPPELWAKDWMPRLDALSIVLLGGTCRVLHAMMTEHTRALARTWPRLQNGDRNLINYLPAFRLWARFQLDALVGALLDGHLSHALLADAIAPASVRALIAGLVVPELANDDGTPMPPADDHSRYSELVGRFARHQLGDAGGLTPAQALALLDTVIDERFFGRDMTRLDMAVSSGRVDLARAVHDDDEPLLPTHITRAIRSASPNMLQWVLDHRGVWHYDNPFPLYVAACESGSAAMVRAVANGWWPVGPALVEGRELLFERTWMTGNAALWDAMVECFLQSWKTDTSIRLVAMFTRAARLHYWTHEANAAIAWLSSRGHLTRETMAREWLRCDSVGRPGCACHTHRLALHLKARVPALGDVLVHTEPPRPAAWFDAVQPGVAGRWQDAFLLDPPWADEWRVPRDDDDDVPELVVVPEAKPVD